jgi:hypothetical protein
MFVFPYSNDERQLQPVRLPGLPSLPQSRTLR